MAHRGDRLVGREAELVQIAAFLDALPLGPRALVLAGEAGVGTTTLWGAALEQTRARGVEALRARAAESEATLPFAGLADLLESVERGRAEGDSVEERIDPSDLVVTADQRPRRGRGHVTTITHPLAG